MTMEKDDASRHPASIEWRTDSSESRKEQSSPDGRWHLDTKTEQDGRRRVHLSNYDLLCPPMGIGEDQAECWRKFIRDCDEYAKKLAAVRDEATSILAFVEGQQATQGNNHE